MNSEDSLWGKLKKNASSVTSNISLPLGNDSDGKHEYETLIHKGLIIYYQEHQNGEFPDWLVEDDPNYNQQGFQTTNHSGNNRFYPVNTANNNTFRGQQSTSSSSNYQRSYSNQSSSSSNTLSNGQAPRQKTQTPASASLHDLYKSNRNSGSSNNSNNSRGTTNNSTIRDRLQQRGGTSQTTANRLQSNWSKR